MPLEDLPDELLGMICSFCNRREIKSLRLTSRALQKIANEHLLSEIVLFMNRDSLEACKGIAAHPVLSKAANTLWIQADRPKKTTFDEWNEDRKRMLTMRFVKEATEIVYPDDGTAAGSAQDRVAQIDVLVKEIRQRHEAENPELSEEQLAYHFAHADRVASEAEEMRHVGSLTKALRDILAGCPRLESVDLTMGNNIRICTSKYNKAFRQGLLHPFDDSEDFEFGFPVMVSLLHAAFDVGLKPTLLGLGGVSHYIFTREYLKDEIHAFFSKVIRLEWQFPVPYDDQDELDTVEMENILDDFEGGDFRLLMEKSTCLERVSLDLPYDPASQDVRRVVLFDDITGDITWKHLTHIRLTSFEASLRELEDFFLRHKSTLTGVLLGDVFLRDGEWPDCFASFAGKLPLLLQFELRGMFVELENWGRTFYHFGLLEADEGNEYSRKISKYLLDGGDECPPRPENQEGPDYHWSEDEVEPAGDGLVSSDTDDMEWVPDDEE